MNTNHVPGQCQSSLVLNKRIDEIIDLIPEDFEERKRIVNALQKRKESLLYTAPTAMEGRWHEVAGILEQLPDPATCKWANKIAVLFSAEIP